MFLKIEVADGSSGKKICMNVKQEQIIEEIIVSAASFWKKKPGVYLLKYRGRILPGDMTVGSAKLKSGSTLMLIPDFYGTVQQ